MHASRRALAFAAAVVAAMAVDPAGAQRATTDLTVGQSKPPPGRIDPGDRQAVERFLESMDRGESVRLVIRSGRAFSDTFRSVAPSWIDAAPEARQEHRRQLTAVAVLYAGLQAAGSGTQGPWRDVKILIEEQCDQLRRGRPAAFERQWMVASATLIQVAGDRNFMSGGSSCDGTVGPCDHASHIESSFPGDPRVALAGLMVDWSGGIAARRPGVLAGQVARSRLQAQVSRLPPQLVPDWGERVSRWTERLPALAGDPVVGADARLRLGLVYYGLNQRAESLRELSLAARSANAEVRYIAHYVSALIHDADASAADAVVELEAALEAVPNVRSGATLLAMKYFLIGRQSDAAAVLDAAFAVPRQAFDPWRGRYGIWAWTEAFDQLVELIRP